MKLKLSKRERLDEDGDLERYCPKCGEWWPADREFFFTTGSHDKPELHSWCKACYMERKKQLKLEKERGIAEEVSDNIC